MPQRFLGLNCISEISFDGWIRNNLQRVGPDDLALHRLSVELTIVVDLDGLNGVRLVDVDDLGRSRIGDLRTFDDPDVAEKLDDVLVADSLLEVRYDHLRTLK